MEPEKKNVLVYIQGEKPSDRNNTSEFSKYTYHSHLHALYCLFALLRNNDVFQPVFIPPFFSLPLPIFLSLFYVSMNVSVTCFYFMGEMQIYSFLNMTDIMRFPMIHQAQIKRLSFEFLKSEHHTYFPLHFHPATVSLLFCFFLFLFQLCVEIITSPNSLDSLSWFYPFICTHTCALWLMADWLWLTFWYLLLTDEFRKAVVMVFFCYI